MGAALIFCFMMAGGIIAFIRSPERAFLNVYLPVLLLFPQNFTERIFFLPALSSADATIILIFIVALLLRFTKWKFSPMDFLVTSFIFIKFISEYYNWGSTEAMNVLATQLCSVWAPYSLTKLSIIPSKLLVKFSTRLTFCVFLAVLFSTYEFFFIENLFLRIPQKYLFPSQGAELGTIFRYGFVRIAGPFGQPILFGIAISLALFLHYWLVKEKLWNRNFKYFAISNSTSFFSVILTKANIITITLILGLIATFSRGPQLSTLIGFSMVGIGHSKFRTRSIIKRLAFVVVVSSLGFYALSSYNSINKDFVSESGSTVLYRMELIDNYYDIVMQKPYLGWGRSGVPMVKNQKSVDNEYLSAALGNGLFIPVIEITMILYTIYRLIRRGLKDKVQQVADSTFAFVMSSIFITMGISFATVYMGLQINQLFFIMLGLAEGYLLSNPEHFYKDQVESYKRTHNYQKQIRVNA